MTESPELKTLKKVIERLEKGAIPYMLTGSMALNFYGHPRATNDFDIVIEIRRADEERLWDLFRQDFYISRDAVHEAIDREGQFNVIDHESVFKIDFIVRKTGNYADEQFRRRRVKELEGLKTLIISPEDLILAKLDWSKESLSEMQERDIKNLMRLLSKELDYSYMEKWAVVLDILERLRSLRASL